MHFDNWKIHHTYEKNWIRNSLILMDGWQLSDNQRGWIIKPGFIGHMFLFITGSTCRSHFMLRLHGSPLSPDKSGLPIPGAYKTMNNSTFVGFTPNTGHRVCAGNDNRYWKVGDQKTSHR